MKPLRLSLSAFGPFAKSIEISFDQVFDGGLFLIHGRTGAGKTSILDGICFSLFGKPSTPEREKDLRALRSDSASAETQTQTELIFTLGAAAYRVKRVPTQIVPKKRGEGDTEIKASATLETWTASLSELRENLKTAHSLNVPSSHWRPIAGNVKDVDARIESLLGMNEKQFRQIVVLPQGRFRDFLSSTSSDRQIILERLFQTDRFSRFQSFVANKAKNLESEWTRVSQTERTKLESLGFASIADLRTSTEILSQRRSSLELSLKASTEQTDRAAKQVNLVEMKLNLVEQKIALEAKEIELLQQTAEIEKLKHDLTVFKTFAQLMELRKRTTALKIEVTRLESELKAVDSDQNDTIQKIATLETESPTLADLEAERTRLLDLHKVVKEAHTLSQDIKRLSDDALKIDQQRAEALQKVKFNLSVLRTQSDWLNDLDRTETHEESRQVEVAKLNQHRLEAEHHLNEARKLSVHLQLGDECPVCGSKDHPLLAHMRGESSESAPTQDLLEESKRSIEMLQRKCAASQAMRKEKTLQFQDRTQELIALSTSLDSSLDIDPGTPSDAVFSKSAPNRPNTFKVALEGLEAISQETKAKLQSAQSLELKLAPLKSQIESLQTRRDALLQPVPLELHDLKRIVELGQALAAKKSEKEKCLGELKTTEQKLRSSRDRIEGQLQSTRKLELQSRELMERELLATGEPSATELNVFEVLTAERAQKMESTIAQHERALVDVQARLQTLNASEQALNDPTGALKGSMSLERVRELATEYKETLKYTLAEREAIESELSTARERIRIQIQAESDIRHSSEALKQIEAQYQSAQKMSLLLSGERPINRRAVPLARFVLQSRFETCLDQANHRLLKMSRGQYQLRRPELSRNLAQSQGLNLTVEDSHTGRQRPADSLSGGESFMAALALALGLSDTIQADLGGIQLDSLFVDEGFGTLDSESLELALRALIDLQSGGRMVGIISHVQELQTQIQERLEVRKETTGSSAQWNSRSMQSDPRNSKLANAGPSLTQTETALVPS